MNSHEQAHLGAFEEILSTLMSQIEISMAEPTAANGFKLRILMERTVGAYLNLVDCVMAEDNPGTPETPNTPKEKVN